jgi:hypothetical protein
MLPGVLMLFNEMLVAVMVPSDTILPVVDIPVVPSS